MGLDVRSLLNIPLRTKGQVIGVLNLVDTQPDRFSDNDLVLLEPIAAAAASAIHNAQLFDEIRHQQDIAEQRIDELSILNRITQTITTLTDPNVILQTVTEIMNSLFKVYSTTISLYNIERKDRTIVAMYDPFEKDGDTLVGKTFPLSTMNFQLIETKQITIISQPTINPLEDVNGILRKRHTVLSTVGRIHDRSRILESPILPCPESPCFWVVHSTRVHAWNFPSQSRPRTCSSSPRGCRRMAFSWQAMSCF
jgi:GAF domain-containing protein